MANSDEKQDVAGRIIALEEWMMHTDQLLANLNEVICSIQNRLDEQDRRIARLKSTLEKSQIDDDQERSFEGERPPHY